VAVESHEIPGSSFAEWFELAGVIPDHRPLDLDHSSAEVCQNHRAIWA
jgi:hypothetical protein